MFSISVGEYTLICHDGGLPQHFGSYLEHARLVEEFDQDGGQGENCLLAVKRGMDWPFLVVTQKSRLPGIFSPGALLVAETRLLFLGLDERLLAYELDGPTKLWEDMTECGFWGWARHGDFIVMSAELEMAAWDIHGTKPATLYSQGGSTNVAQRAGLSLLTLFPDGGQNEPDGDPRRCPEANPIWAPVDFSGDGSSGRGPWPVEVARFQ